MKDGSYASAVEKLMPRLSPKSLQWQPRFHLSKCFVAMGDAKQARLIMKGLAEQYPFLSTTRPFKQHARTCLSFAASPVTAHGQDVSGTSTGVSLISLVDPNREKWRILSSYDGSSSSNNSTEPMSELTVVLTPPNTTSNSSNGTYAAITTSPEPM